MSSYSFKLPDLGEGTVESEIVEWRVQVGDLVNADQPLVDMMTEKATVEITAPVSGKVISLAGNPGDVISVGSELVVFDTSPEESTQITSEVIDEPAEAEAGVTKPEISHQPVTTANKPLTSPAIRQLAREKNVDLTQVPATGPKGRITRKDIDAFINQGNQLSVNQSKTRLTGTREIKMTGLRRKIAERMTLSASRIPHFTYVEEVDITELEQVRQHLNASRKENRPKLTYLPFFMQALVKVLKEFPQCNAHFDDTGHIITQYDPIHIGIATQTENGLMVPVIRHVEALDLWECAHELRQVTTKARNGSASKEELTGSTITITSLGALGGIVSTPIINHPEVAIIGVNKTQKRQVVENNMTTTQLMMNLSSSFDHRVIDGYDAARVIQSLKNCLQFPATLFIREPDC